MTTQPRVSPFDPDTSGQAPLDEYAALVLASMALDFPDSFQRTPAMLIRQMRDGDPGEGDRLRWAAYLGDRMAGFMMAVIPEKGGVAFIKITVHPELRCRGAGTALLRTVLPILRERGRTTIEGWWIAADGVGEQWARNQGFRRTHATVAQTLSLPDVDLSGWAAETPAGYRTVEWVNRAPEELIASYAAARRAIEDAPLGDAAFESPDWTVERIRTIEAEQRQQGAEQRVVAAVHEESGAVVGFTETELYPDSKDLAYQYDTAVLPAHRGHGLGLHIKARMAERLRALHPEIARISTSTGTKNTHMIRVNTTLGFVTTHTMAVVTGNVDELSRPLAAVRDGEVK